MAEIIEGDFKRMKRRAKRKSNNLAGSGSIGTDIWEWTHPGQVQTESVALTGANKAQDQGIFDNFKQSFADAVAKLDQASQALDDSESALLAIQSDALNDPDYASEWQNQYNKVIAAQSTRDSALSAIQTASGWIDSAKQTFGLSGVVAIPWATVAAITAATAAILAIVFAANNFYNMFVTYQTQQINNDRQMRGLPPLDQPQLMSTGIGSGIGNFFGNITQWVVIGVVAYFLLNNSRKGA